MIKVFKSLGEHDFPVVMLRRQTSWKSIKLALYFIRVDSRQINDLNAKEEKQRCTERNHRRVFYVVWKA